ncbi:MAG: TetR/AcrR family transcriptional regulator [Candidatus Aminicenantales bacterium]
MSARQERIKSILKAAETIFLRHGFNDSSMDEIADMANLGKGTIYYYFKGKEEIFFTILEREANTIYKEMVKRVSGKKPLYKIIREVMFFYVEYFSKNPAFLRLFFPCIAGLIKIENKKQWEKYKRSYRKHLQFIRMIISKKIKEEGIPISSKALLSLINVIQIGIGLKLLEGKEKEAKDSMRIFLKIVNKPWRDE